MAAMLIFGNFSTVMWLYLAMHGTHSILWLIKGHTYPDRRFAEPVPIWIGIVFVFLPLAGYYAAPILLAWLHPQCARIGCRAWGFDLHVRASR